MRRRISSVQVNRREPRPLLLAFLLASTLAVWPASTSADTRLGVAPSLIEVSASGPGQATQELVVFNEGRRAVTVEAAIEPYRQAGGERSAVAWLKVSPKAFALDPGQRQRVEVGIEVPAGALPGGRYAAVAFRSSERPLAPAGNGDAAIAPFLITSGPSSSLVRQAALESLRPVLEQDGRLGFRALLANRGNVHLVSSGGSMAVERLDASAGGSSSRPERLSFASSPVVLPGSSELLPAQGGIDWREGAVYRSKAGVDTGGGATATAENTFTARTALRVGSLSVEEGGERGRVARLDLRDDGTVGVVPRVQLAVKDASGKVAANIESTRQLLLWPGESAQIEGELPPGLAGGRYSVVARVAYGTAAPVERKVALEVGDGLSAGRDRPPSSFGLASFLIAMMIAFGLGAIGYQRLAGGYRPSRIEWQGLRRAMQHARVQVFGYPAPEH